MHLVRLRLSADGISLPRAVRAFLREADRRIERFRRDRHFPGFVPCDYAKAYAVLRALAAGDLAPGRLSACPSSSPATASSPQGVRPASKAATGLLGSPSTKAVLWRNWDLLRLTLT